MFPKTSWPPQSPPHPPQEWTSVYCLLQQQTNEVFQLPGFKPKCFPVFHPSGCRHLSLWKYILSMTLCYEINPGASITLIPQRQFLFETAKELQILNIVLNSAALCWDWVHGDRRCLEMNYHTNLGGVACGSHWPSDLHAPITVCKGRFRQYTKSGTLRCLLLPAGAHFHRVRSIICVFSPCLLFRNCPNNLVLLASGDIWNRWGADRVL